MDDIDGRSAVGGKGERKKQRPSGEDWLMGMNTSDGASRSNAYLLGPSWDNFHGEERKALCSAREKKRRLHNWKFVLWML